MKAAVIADLHLTDNPASVKLSVLDWALERIADLKVDCLIGIGDLTATGTAVQTNYLMSRIRKCGIPFFAVPGNAELRSREQGEAAQTLPPPEDFPVLLIDSSRDCPAENDLYRLAELPENARKLLATHCPPQYWKNGKEIFESACRRNAVSRVIAGHLHDDRPGCMRGLDPDKASGGPPMFSVVEQKNDGSWLKLDHVMPGVDPGDWTKEEKSMFLDFLGVAALREPIETLEAAARLNIPVVELRFGYPLDYTDDMDSALKIWRSNGGKILSVHLPEVKPDDTEALDMVTKSAEFSLRAGCDRVTIHVPRITASEYPGRKDEIVKLYLKLLEPLLNQKIEIGIENLHTSKGKTADEERNFGCTPLECRDFITALRTASGSDLFGLHLDLGHARNNAPFSAVWNVSDYFNVPGLPINGYHIHQVKVLEDGTMQNHAPMTDFYGKLISMSSFFLAYRQRVLSPGIPMILEINLPGGGILSWKKFSSEMSC
ncbi:MAG: metallophosphoesterase [Lentisphaeria bacterium]|nr:metallophosphoesterase [Lentisphaeria bacterium]